MHADAPICCFARLHLLETAVTMPFSGHDAMLAGMQAPASAAASSTEASEPSSSASAASTCCKCCASASLAAASAASAAAASSAAVAAASAVVVAATSSGLALGWPAGEEAHRQQHASHSYLQHDAVANQWQALLVRAA